MRHSFSCIIHCNIKTRVIEFAHGIDGESTGRRGWFPSGSDINHASEATTQESTCLWPRSLTIGQPPHTGNLDHPMTGFRPEYRIPPHLHLNEHLKGPTLSDQLGNRNLTMTLYRFAI